MRLLESYLFYLPSLSCMKTFVLTFSNPVRLNINSVNDSSPSKVSSSMIVIVAVYTEGSIATVIIYVHTSWYNKNIIYLLLVKLLVVMENDSPLCCV